MECYRVIWLSIYGIPCYVRNTSFLETILADIGTLANNDKLDEKSDRLNVLKVMVFTNQLGLINRKINACVDGGIFSILVMEDVSVSYDKGALSSTISSSSLE